MITQGVVKHVLPNGLTVLVKENHAAPVVAIVTYVKAGYYNEPDRLVGISHLIEHMFFKGTRRRGVGQIARETKALGGYLNASTSYDYTIYYTVLPSRSFVQGLDIQADALMNSIFDPNELRKETEVVIQEAKRKLDTPSALATEKLFETAFEKHRMRRWRIGTESGLRSLTRDDFLNFYRSLYRPENIVLVVSGDVESDEALRQVERFYGDFEKGQVIKETSPPEPPQNRLKHRRLSGDLTQAYLELGYHTVPVLHDDAYAMDILTFVLGSGRSSRLNQRVKEEKRLVNTIAASHYNNEELGYLNISATLGPEHLAAAEEAIFIELERLKLEPISSDELAKARNALETSYVRNMETMAGVANVLAYYEALGDFHLAETYQQRLYQVTPADVLRVADTYLRLTNCALLEYLPDEAEVAEWQADALAQRLQEATTAAFSDGAATAMTGSDQTRSTVGEAPAVTTPDRAPDRPVERILLANGATLIVRERHQLPLVSAAVFFRGGRLNEDPKIAGRTNLMLRAALKGTQTRSASQIASEIEALGTSIRTHNDADFFGFSLSVLTKHFDRAWDILCDVIVRPTFPEEEVEKERRLAIAAIRRSRDDMFRYPLQLFCEALWKDHPYALPGDGYEESVARLQQPDLRHWHLRHLSAENLLVAVVGDLKTDEVRQRVEDSFADLRSGQKIQLPEPPPPPAAGVVERAETRQKAQTALVLGFGGPRYTDETHDSLIVLQNLASGLGGRFFEELRDRQGLAYTVAAFLMARRLGGSFLAYIATSPEQEEVARAGLLAEFEKLVRQPVSDEELQQSKSYTIGSHEIGLETLSGELFEYARHELLGRGIEGVALFPERIERVDKEKLQKAAQRYFSTENYAVGIVRGSGQEVDP